MAATVPTVASVDDVYPEASRAAQRVRWGQLLERFAEQFGGGADFVARAPGRVNIIGEHIDYMLFSVLPMAIEADVLVAVRVVPHSDTVRVANVQADRYPVRTFAVDRIGEIDASLHEWTNYFKAGLRGAVEFLQKRGNPGARTGVDPGAEPGAEAEAEAVAEAGAGAGSGAVRVPGMQVLVDGSVPAGGGLSSSAAFVCASALAALVAMGGGAPVQRTALVELAIVAERLVGVHAGGMDQAASVLGEAGSASLVSFAPALAAQPVALPRVVPAARDGVFLIANTLRIADKHVTAPVQYNLRVVETTLAALVLSRALGVGPLPLDAGPLGLSLRGAMDAYFAAQSRAPPESEQPQPQPLDQRLAEMVRLAETLLRDDCSRAQLADMLGLSGGADALAAAPYMTAFPVRADRFHLRSRALHVFGEARRVVLVHQLLARASTESAGAGCGEEVLAHVGMLMDASQQSCRDLFDCSCPELDTLCRLARGAGAYGSRLTGAGWGGCSVHLVPADRVAHVRRAWVDGYYSRFATAAADEPTEAQLRDAVVESKPGAGAILLRVVPGQPL